MHPIRNIVIGVAEPAPADPAVLAGLDIARRTGAVVHAAHGFRLPLPSLLDPLLCIDRESAQRLTEQVRADFAARMAGAFPGQSIECHALADTPARAIHRIADRLKADMVIVGATQHGRVSRALLGTTAQRVLHGTAQPVLVVRSAPVSAGRILIATDLSHANAAAFERGLDLVERLGAHPPSELRALLVLVTPLSPAPLAPDAVSRRANGALADFLADRCRRTKTITPVVRHGFPSVEIAAEADQWGADLVLLGSHSIAGSNGWVLGSVAEAAVRDVRCNVLVVPPVPPAEAAAAPGARAVA